MNKEEIMAQQIPEYCQPYLLILSTYWETLSTLRKILYGT